jgi:hypothetical protein
MHYWYNMNVLERLTDGPYRTQFLETNKFMISKETLPSRTEIFVLKVIREGDL